MQCVRRGLSPSWSSFIDLCSSEVPGYTSPHICSRNVSALYPLPVFLPPLTQDALPLSLALLAGERAATLLG
eukprot:1120733-Rhodomonas_salina.2